jgi:phage repressor protein C with HTH and peptisase S24 domain
MTDILSHAQIWAALDALGERYGLTPSGLARKAGLDPTTFNRSKRETASGRQRWPSTESIAKVLQATGAGLDEFMALVSANTGAARRHTRPLIGLAQAGTGGFFDDAGFATGAGWDEIDVLADADEHSYALEISGDSMSPLYRDGDIVIVSPSAPVRRGDRVVVKTTAGEIMAKELKRQTGRSVELRSINPGYPDRVIPREEVSWIARILWASQ